MMERKMRSRPAFTAIELIVVLAIFVVAIAVTLPFLGKFQQQETLTTVTQDLHQALRRAQNKAMNGERGVRWGVAFTSNSYTVYAGPAYGSGRIVGLDERHSIPDVFMVFAPLDISFAERTGRISKELTIRIQGPEGGVSVLTINPEGGIFYESP